MYFTYAAKITFDQQVFHDEINELLNEVNIPGASVIAINGSYPCYEDAFGLRSISPVIKNDLTSIFNLASVSKTITGIVVMKLVEIGQLDLDQNINFYIDFYINNPTINIVHPNYSNNSITLRLLLTHYSSINTQFLPNIYFPFDNFTINNPDYGNNYLGGFVLDYLLPSGKYYNESNWLPVPPGSEYSYSNVGIALVAWLCEVATGEYFYSLTNKYLFKPLGMSDATSWFLKSVPTDKQNLLMRHYIFNETNQTFFQNSFSHLSFNSFPDKDHPQINWTESEPYGYYIYPGGLLRSTIGDLAMHLSMFITNGTYLNPITNKSVEILKASTVAEMSRIQYPQFKFPTGLIWTYYTLNVSRVRFLLGHTGSDIGVTTFMFFNPQTQIGVILLTTGNVLSTNDWQNDRIRNQLWLIMDKVFNAFESKPISDCSCRISSLVHWCATLFIIHLHKHS
ncbi:unnamed protein product [Didymodactylos carnosus]|nr:unnamed protein product [Didymodactylos carnosus]CAF3608231.1 unnamed protein product [Didymodactylos carnosus]